MKRGARLAVVATIWATGLVRGEVQAGLRGEESQTGRAQMEVRVYDRVGVPQVALKFAEARTREIFRPAGVEMRWVNCATAKGRVPADLRCDTAPTPLVLTLHIVDPKHAMRGAAGCGHALNSVPPGEFADHAVVIYQCIADLTRNRFAARYEAFANVIVHEFGHLLLGPGSHSSVGVMALTLSTISTSLDFTREQRVRIQYAVRARAEAEELRFHSAGH